MSGTKSALVVCNPSAGRGQGLGIGGQVRERLAAEGFTVDVHQTCGPGGARDIVRSHAADAGLVVVVGGDGTVNEAVNGLGDLDIPLGIVPAGTVNVLALELGIPLSPADACEVIVGGRALRMDVGIANGRRFCLMAGAGTDAQTISHVDPVAKRRFRKLAFVATGARCLLTGDNAVFRVRTAEQEYFGTLAVAGNSRYYAGRFGLTTRADPTDGLLDVLVYRGTGFVPTALFWLGTPFGAHVHHPGVTYLRAREVELEVMEQDDEVLFQTDGELAGRLPLVIGVKEQALRVLVPKPEDWSKKKGRSRRNRCD